MKPVVLGAVGVGVFAAALAAVFLFLDDAGAPAVERAPAPVAAVAKGQAPAAASTDAIQPMLAEAERLLNRGDTPAAKEVYTRARAAAKRQGPVAEAAVAFGLGRLEHFNGQSDAARAAFAEALALYGQAGDAADQARVLVAFGDLEKDTFRGAQAKQHYRAAREQWAKVPEPKSDPHVILNMDRAALMPAGEARARAVLEQADKIFHNIDDAEGEGDVAMLLGALEWNLGKVGPASAAFQSARSRYAAAANKPKEAEASLSVALAEIRQGYNIAAKESLRAAAALAASDSRGAARLLAAEGDLERLQGRLAQARTAFAAAVPQLPADGAVAAALKLAAVQRAQGDVDGAKATLQGALLQAGADRVLEAQVRLELGLVLAGQGDAAARDHLNAASAALQGTANAGGEARAMLGAGDLALRRNDANAAVASFDAATAAFVRAGVPFGAVQTSIAKGDALRAAGKNAEAATAYRDALAKRGALNAPVAEAARLLGLPQVEQVQYLVAGEEAYDENPPDPAIVRAAQATRAANLAAFPESNKEARDLLKEVDARLAAVAEFIRAAN